MDPEIAGLRVPLTGGGSGIGLAVARAFVTEGAHVHVCDADPSALEAIGRSDPALGRSRCDVADRDEVGCMFDAAIAELAGLDCLVNNAGIAGPIGRVDEIDPADRDRCIAIDLTGQFNCARLAVPHVIRPTNGSIVNLSLQAGKHGFPMRAPYAAAKWGCIGLTKALAAELGGFGVRVNAICPGLVERPQIQHVIAGKAEALGISEGQMTERLFAGISIKRFVPPEAIARQIVFLASPHAWLISGQEISVCGDTRMLS
jgi:NAD(P)-dependent dehydrogenase (short-subunit alcohol dehydrogenase family)